MSLLHNKFSGFQNDEASGVFDLSISFLHVSLYRH